jgi:hypothetical protein
VEQARSVASAIADIYDAMALTVAENDHEPAVAPTALVDVTGPAEDVPDLAPI